MEYKAITILIEKIPNCGVLPKRSFEWKRLFTDVQCVFRCFYNASSNTDPAKRDRNKKDRISYESKDFASIEDEKG